MAITEIVRNDKGFDLEFTVTDSDGAAVNLTGATVTFKMAAQSATTSKVSTTISVTGATSGTAVYTVTSSDTDTVGIYNAELQINYTSIGKIITANMGQIRIVEDLP